MATNHKTKGIIWVNAYPDRMLGNSGMCTNDFFDTLDSSLTGHFKHGDTETLQALDTDIQEEKVWDANPADSIGPAPYSPGEDRFYAEKVDILYFCGHGTPEQIFFAQPNTATYPNENKSAHYSDIKLGNMSNGSRIKWLIADACQVLQENGIFNRWPQIFHPGGTLRGILRFHNSCMNDNTRGKIFAERLNRGDTLKDAWNYACTQTDNVSHGVEWAVLFAGDNQSMIANDRWTDAVLPDVPAPLGNGKQTFTYLRRSFTPAEAQLIIPEFS